MNQKITDLLKKIRVQALIIKGGFSECAIRETTIENKWGDATRIRVSMKNPDHQCSVRKLVDTDKLVVITIHALAGSSFYGYICTDADATYQVATGNLYDTISKSVIDMQKPHTFPANTLHEIEIREESIFTVTYTNFK